MSARTVDVLIFIPLIPAIPVIAFWFWPWERWIPKIIPKKVIGRSAPCTWCFCGCKCGSKERFNENWTHLGSGVLPFTCCCIKRE